MLSQIKTAVMSLFLVVALVATGLAGPAATAYSPYPLQAADTEVADALDYLRGQQAADEDAGVPPVLAPPVAAGELERHGP